jgi:hypothetical protein
MDEPVAAGSIEPACGRRHQLLQRPLQEVFRAMQAGPDRAFAQTQSFGGIQGVEAVDLAQDKDGSIGSGQPAEGGGQYGVQFNGIGLSFGVRRWGGDHVDERVACRLSTAPQRSPPPRERLMNGDARDPRPESSTAFELREVPIRGQIRLLHGIFSFGVTVDDGPNGTIEVLVVTPHEDFEHFGVACPDAKNDLLIGRRAMLNESRHF